MSDPLVNASLGTLGPSFGAATSRPEKGAEPEALAELDVSKLIGFRLWKLASLSGAPVIRLCEGRFGVTRIEWALLALVAREGQISPSDLSIQAGIDRPCASRAIRALIAKKLLQRYTAKCTGRRYDLQLTAEGRDLVTALYGEIRAFSDAVLGCLDVPTRTVFESALQQLTQYAERLNKTEYVEPSANRSSGTRKSGMRCFKSGPG